MGPKILSVPGVFYIKIEGGTMTVTDYSGEEIEGGICCWLTYGSIIYDCFDSNYLPKMSGLENLTGDTVTVDDFNNLLNQLRQAGFLL